MKNFNSKSLAISAAIAAMFVFSGCNSEMGSVPSDPSIVKSANSDTVSKPAASAADNSDNLAAETPSKVSAAQRQEFLDAINAARAETQDCGTEGIFEPAPALKWNNKLDNAAYEHSYDLAQSNTFSHTGSGTASDITALEEHLDRGSKFYERIRHHGYTSYRTVGENIAAGYDSAQEVVDAWLESDHHCANLMNPKFTEVGMALVEDIGTEYGTYWSQEFGGK